ncbi:MAG: Wzz/FepE/Etk N-terminal domain-containing protein [Hyphomicrobiaceae bacterium]
MQNDQSYSDDDEEAGGAINVDRILYAVRKRWRMIVAIAILATVMSVGIVLCLPLRYDASAIVQIDPRKKTISDLDGVLANLKADGAVVDSEQEIIRSRRIVLRVIDVLNLRNDLEFTAPSLLQKVTAWFGFGKEKKKKGSEVRNAETNQDPIASLLGPEKLGRTNPEADEIAVSFLRRLKVTRIRKTLLINIRFSSSDPVKTARIANTIAEVYLNEQVAEKQRAAGIATKALENKLTELRFKLADAERKVEEYKAQNNIFNSEGQILSEKHLARLQEQLVMARNTTAEARAKYVQARELREQGLSNNAITDVLESNTVRLLKEQLGSASQKYAELRTKYGNRHPSIKKARAELDDVQRRLSAEISRLVENLENKYEIASQREVDLKSSLQDLKTQQVKERRAGVNLMDLERESSTTKQLYESLLARYKQTSETQTLQLPDARIVEQADAPLYPASPKRRRLVLVAAIAGLVVGLILALVLEFATLGLGRPEDVEQVFELNHLSSLPQVSFGNNEVFDPLQAVRLVIKEPTGSFAESVRGVRREIDINRPIQGGPSVILIAGSLPGEGTSMTASNLAHHYAMTGNRVLLIDADLRFMGLSRQLAPARRVGLADILANGQRPETAILRDTTTELHFMPAAGTTSLATPSPELLAGPRMAAALKYLKSQFDTIIIDSPPLLPVFDGRILADYADQILFVTTWRKTPKQLAKRALKTIQVNQQKILGVIVNQVAQDIVDDSRGIAYRPQSVSNFNDRVNRTEQKVNPYTKAA